MEANKTPERKPPGVRSSSNPRIKTSECKRYKGIVTDADAATVVNKGDICKDIEYVYSHIRSLMKDKLETNGDEIESFYIGKSSIDKIPGTEFSPTNNKTWNIEKGVEARYRAHKTKPFCKNSLIVVALVTRGCIDSPKKGITHEDYALALEKCLILKFLNDGRYRSKLANDTTDSGLKSKTEYPAYVIYVTFSLKGKNPMLTYVKVDTNCILSSLKIKMYRL